MTRKILITGGAGFTGVNVADYYLKQGKNVIVFDNLSRRGSELNLRWLKKRGKLQFIKGDVCNYNQLKAVFKKHKNIDVIFHLAAQVAVTTSVENPRSDFENNLLGSFNLLEAIRNYSKKSILIYSSTNKVYGALENLGISEKKSRYEFTSPEFQQGIPEGYPLDFHSPYGCSKGAVDQYVRDYNRIYGLNTIVFRQSCIYGPRQFGVEDQGWVAWFIIAALLNKPITIYGNGKQVRDLLYINDLISVYDLAIKNINKTAGQVYNMGGGFNNTLSLLELIEILEKFLGRKIKISFSKTRPGDQKIFIADILRAKKHFNWMPKIGVNRGIKRLFNWISENIEEVKKINK
jgi:CDP-paratose 2-epimerase